MSGTKNDAGKVDLSLVPLEALKQEALGFMLGASKYGRHNFRKGMEASRLVSAAQRHLLAWFNGERLDPDPKAQELGLETTHLGNARCCLAMLITLEESGALIDDRYGAPTPTAPEALTSAKLTLKVGDMVQLRNGDMAWVRAEEATSDWPFKILHEDGNYSWVTFDGYIYKKGYKSPFDVIAAYAAGSAP